MEEVDFIVLHALARLYGVEVGAKTTGELTGDQLDRAKAGIADAIVAWTDRGQSRQVTP